MANKEKSQPRAQTENSAPGSQLRQGLESQQALLAAQPPLVQRFLETQAAQIAEAILQNLPQLRFVLPDKVVTDPKKSKETKPVPAEAREQLAGGLFDRLARNDIRDIFRQRLAELEQWSNSAVSVSAVLVRFTTARHMVHNMLPEGRRVTYRTADGEEIPTIPEVTVLDVESAITAPTDAIALPNEASSTVDESGRGELLVPYVPAARHFFLPQWVAFDEQGNILVNSVNAAEAQLGSMQHYLEILHAAVSLDPYLIADEEYQRKRYGILGQLVNQGRALARYETLDIIKTIQRRAASNDLNRGLSLSLPYFDDQDLQMKMYNFEVIPAGRIMFVPAFVVRAAREEAVKVAQDTRLSPSTRKYLLNELALLEQAFTKK